MRRAMIVGLLLVCGVTMLSGCAARIPVASKVFSYACAAGGDCAVYMTLTNSSSQADALVAVRTDVAGRAELHTLVRDSQGGATMQAVENFSVPASGTVDLKPGARHIMLVGLNRELKAGDSFSLTLEYEKSGENTVQVQVRTKN